MGSSMLDEDLRPVDVRVDDQMIRVRFSGGLEIATPVDRYPRLKNAAPAMRERWQLVGRASGIHWPDADEDISIRGLFSTARTLPASPIEQIPVLISDLLRTTSRLNALFEGRPFTPDGHLVGSIGEVVAEYIYDLQLERCSTPHIDAYTKTEFRQSVQVKLTGERGQSFGVRWPSPTVPDLLICMQMTARGFEEIYNGPFPKSALEEKPRSTNGQVSLRLSRLKTSNPSTLARVRSFESINRWFQATPDLAEVA